MDTRARHLPGLGACEGARGAAHIATIAIGDPFDPRVADYRDVPDPERIERRGLFIAEGRLVVQRLLAGRHFAVRSLMVTRVALEAVSPEMALHADLPIYVVPPHLMNEIAGFNFHRGCLAVGERGTPLAWRELAAGARRLVILERVGDADNVGSIFRNAAAFGVDAVLLDPASTDPFYRKALRTSMGATLRIPFARVGVDQWPHALTELRRDGMVLVALTPSADSPCLQSVTDRLTGRRVALVVGHEGDGLTREALDACELRVRIPMTAGVDSINVATSAAIAMYELRRSHG